MAIIEFRGGELEPMTLSKKSKNWLIDRVMMLKRALDTQDKEIVTLKGEVKTKEAVIYIWKQGEKKWEKEKDAMWKVADLNARDWENKITTLQARLAEAEAEVEGYRMAAES